MKVLRNTFYSFVLPCAGTLLVAGVLGAAPQWLSLWSGPEAATPPEMPIGMMQGGGGSFLGIGVAEIDNERAQALNLKEERGVEITRVDDDSPAAKAGLQKGDVVLEYSGQRVEGTEQLVRLVRETPVGRSVKIVVSRSGNLQTLAATTAARKTPTVREFRFEMPGMPGMPMPIPMPDVPRPYMGWRSAAVGIEAEALDSQLAEYFGVKEGVLVRSVVKGSAAEKAGLKAGDVITKVDGEKVASPRDISSAVRSKRSQKTLPLTLMRERREMTVNVTLEDDTTPRRPTTPATPRGRSVRTEEMRM